MKRTLSALLLLAFSASELWQDGENSRRWFSSAVAAEQVRTEDGRIILLKEDGTYEIIRKIVPKDSYQSVSFDDLILLKSSLSGKRIKFSAFIYNDGDTFNGSHLAFKDETMAKGSIWVNFADIPIDEKRSFLERCNGLCRMKVEGVMDKTGRVTAEHLVP